MKVPEELSEEHQICVVFGGAKIAREISDQRDDGNALWSICLSLDKLGQRARAIERAKSALEIFRADREP